jgi:hypothetical protein
MGTSACRLQLDLNTTVEDDGGGQIEVVASLDSDAIERVGGDLATVLEVDDLQTAGWTVDGPTLDADGFTRVRVSRPFASPEEAAAIYDEIDGADGPFRDVAVTRTTSFASTEWEFTGRVDFSGGVEAFSDAGIAAELDGEPLGQSVADIEAQLGEPLSDAIQVSVTVHLPGAVTSNASTEAEDGGVWEAAWGAAPFDLEAQGEETRPATVIAAAVGVGCLVILVGYGAVVVVRRRRAGRRSGAHLADDGA